LDEFQKNPVKKIVNHVDSGEFKSLVNNLKFSIKNDETKEVAKIHSNLFESLFFFFGIEMGRLMELFCFDDFEDFFENKSKIYS
jgi:hypothetical protein